MAKNKYGFRTGYNQRSIMISGVSVGKAQADTGYSGASGLDVGQVVTLTGTTLSEKTSGVAIGDYIIAQSDETVGYGHIPVENRDYKYTGIVTFGNNKNVVVYQVTDVADMVKIV